jgi:hypothetical protein
VIPAFDIFKIDKDGHLLWCAAAMTIDDANAKAATLAQVDPCAYVIFNQKTGKHSTIPPPSSPRQGEGPGGRPRL